MPGSSCLSPFCGAQSPGSAPTCPACGRPAFGEVEVARRGWHVVQLGAIQSLVMAAVIWMLAPNLRAALAGELLRNPAANAQNALLVVTILGAMLLMGIALFASGIRMIRGRSSRWSTRAGILLFLTALLAIAAFVVRAYLLQGLGLPGN